MNQSLLVYEIRPSLSSTNTRSQVVVGFMLSAYLTLTVVIVHYFVGKRISENPIDRRLTRRFRSSTPAKQSGTAAETWNAAAEASVLLFSDTQVITGMAILL